MRQPQPALSICLMRERPRGGFGPNVPSDALKPSFYASVEFGAPAYIDADAAVISVAHVFPDGSRVVSLEGEPKRCRRVDTRDSRPISLGSLDIGRLMNLDAEDQTISLDPQELQPPEEHPDQARVGVREADLFASAPRLVLHSFRPIRNDASHEQLTWGQLADFRRSPLESAGGAARQLAVWRSFRPVSEHARSALAAPPPARE